MEWIKIINQYKVVCIIIIPTNIIPWKNLRQINIATYFCGFSQKQSITLSIVK